MVPIFILLLQLVYLIESAFTMYYPSSGMPELQLYLSSRFIECIMCQCPLYLVLI